MIFTYNKTFVGDVLMVIVKDDKGEKRSVDRKGKVARVFLQNSGETVAWNIFDVSEISNISGNGQVFLSDNEVSLLNEELTKNGFTEQLENDMEAKFVIGEVVAMEAHSDSDHLNICQVKVAGDKVVQIVAGAPKARVG